MIQKIGKLAVDGYEKFISSLKSQPNPLKAKETSKVADELKIVIPSKSNQFSPVWSSVKRDSASKY